MSGDLDKLVQEYQQKNKTALVLGGTGECGKAIVHALLSSRVFAKVVLIGRRTVTYEDELYKDVEQRVVDFDNLDAHADAFKNFDVGYCCLGTTRTQVGREGFYRVDHDYIINSAQMARNGGCSQFHLVSSIGANKDSVMFAARIKDGFYLVDHDYIINSAQMARNGGCSQFHLVSSMGANKDSVFFATRIKGESEEAVKAMGFDSVFIYRAALVLSKRERPRAVDTFFKVLFKPITLAFPTVLSVPVTTLAQVVLKKTVTPTSSKFEILENREMHRVAAAD